MSKENLDISLSHLQMFSSVELLGHVRLFATLWSAGCKASLSITNSWSLLKLMSIKLVMSSNHLILCFALLLLSIFPSIRVFFNESVLCTRWPKYWELQLQHQSFQWIFRVDFLSDWLVWSCSPWGRKELDMTDWLNWLKVCWFLSYKKDKELSS